MKSLFEAIVREVSYRTNTGIVDFKNREHISILSEVLDEFGCTDIKHEWIKNLYENQEDEKYSHLAYGYYVKKGDEDKEDAKKFRKEDDKYVPVSDAEYEDRAKDQGDMGGSKGNSKAKTKDGTPAKDADIIAPPAGEEEGEAEPEMGTALSPKTKGGQAYVDSLPDNDPAKGEPAAKSSVALASETLKINPGRINTAVDNAKSYIDKSSADEETKAILKDGIQKIFNGEDVDPSKLETIKKWISVRIGGGNSVGVYVAKTEGNFSDNTRKSAQIPFKTTVDIDDELEKWNDSLASKYGLSMTTQTGAYVNKKDFTAVKMNKERRKVSFEASEGSVKIDGVEYKKRPSIDEHTLVQSFLKKGVSEEQATGDAKKVILAIERRNDMIGKLSELKEMEVVEYGKTDTDANRKKTLTSTIKNTKEGILKSIEKFSKLSKTEIEKQYGGMLKHLDVIEKSAPINNPKWDSMNTEERKAESEKYLKNLIVLLEDIRNEKNLAPGGPDLAEVVVFMYEVGKGNQTFLPSSSNFPTVDIVSFTEQSKPDDNLSPEELAEFYANDFMANSISFIDSDADSVKLGKGGASAGHKKASESNFASPQTGEVLDTLMDCYTGTFGGYPPKAEDIDKAEQSYNAAKQHLMEVLRSKGYSDKEALDAVEKNEKDSSTGYESAKAAFKKSQNDEELDSEFDRGLQVYNKAGKLFEMIYNEDLVSNKFGNTRFKESTKDKKKVIELEVLDGINVKCCVSFNPNPGELKIKDNKGVKTAGINVSFSTWIVECKKSEK